MIVILILTYLLTVLGDKRQVYTTYQLRGMFEKEKNKAFQYITEIEYEHIYNGVLQQAMIGKTDLQFTILCRFDINIHNLGVNSIFNSGDNSGVIELFNIMQIYEITSELLSPKVLDKLKIKFPDSKIILETDFTKIIKEKDRHDMFSFGHQDYNPNKCVIYTISW